MQCAQPLFCFLERFLLTSSTPHCSAFLALFGYNCSDSGIKGWGEEGKKVEKRESLPLPPPPSPFKSQLAKSNILLLAYNVQGEMAGVFLFYQLLCGNYIVERILFQSLSSPQPQHTSYQRFLSVQTTSSVLCIEQILQFKVCQQDIIV